MAKIITENIIISFSKVAKDSTANTYQVIDEDIQRALEQVAQELVGDNIVVEVNKV